MIVPLDACDPTYLPSRNIKSKSPAPELFAMTLCIFRILRVLVSVITKINTSNNADASHALARSENRTTIFSKFEMHGRKSGTYN